MVLIAFCAVLLIAQPKKKRKRERCAVSTVQFRGDINPTAATHSSGAIIAVGGNPEYYEVFETINDVGS